MGKSKNLSHVQEELKFFYKGFEENKEAPDLAIATNATYRPQNTMN
jgi:hypothetical protein